MKYIKQIEQVVRALIGREKKSINDAVSETGKIVDDNKATEVNGKPSPVSRKYSDLMKWQDQMLKEVGLNIPQKWEDSIKSTPSQTQEFTVTFIRRKPRMRD